MSITGPKPNAFRLESVPANTVALPVAARQQQSSLISSLTLVSMRSAWYLLGMDVRRIALINCVLLVLSVVLPVWNVARSVATAATSVRWSIMVITGMAPFLVVMPLFYFALYRDRGTLRVSRRMRLVASIAAAVVAAISLAQLPAWLASLGAVADQSVLTPGGRSWGLHDLSAVSAQLATLAYILLLVTFWRGPRNEPNFEVPVSKLLRVVTVVTVVVWGAVVAVSVLRLVFTPYTYAQIQTAAAQAGRTPPTLGFVMWDAARFLFSQAGVLAAPFIVWRSTRRAAGEESSVPPIPADCEAEPL